MKLRYILLGAMIATTIGLKGEDRPVNGLTIDANGIRSGDKLTRVNLNYSDNITSDTLSIWDFSKISIKDSETITNYHNYDKSIVLENENKESRLYSISKSGTQLLRHYRGGLDVKYKLPEKLHYPIMCGSIRQDKFFGEGDLANTSYIKNAGFSIAKIDLTGDLITPDGDTLSNVVRFRYHRSATTHITDNFRSSFTTTQDSSLFSNDSICYWLANDSVTHSIDKWQWYARGYRYPIIEMRKYKTYLYGVPSDSIIIGLYYPIKTQIEEIENDSINEYYRENHIEGYKLPRTTYGSKTNNYGNVSDSEQKIGNIDVSCLVSPTITSSNVEAMCYTTQKTNAICYISSSAGMLLWSEEIILASGYTSVQIPMWNLPKGIYIVVAEFGGKRFSTKIVKTE